MFFGNINDKVAQVICGFKTGLGLFNRGVVITIEVIRLVDPPEHEIELEEFCDLDDPYDPCSVCLLDEMGRKPCDYDHRCIYDHVCDYLNK